MRCVLTSLHATALSHAGYWSRSAEVLTTIVSSILRVNANLQRATQIKVYCTSAKTQ